MRRGLNTAQRIAKNVLALLSSEIVIRILTFIITLLIARKLGVQAFGKYSFTLAFVALFAVLADLGIGTLTTRNVAREKSLAGKYAGNLFLAKIILGLAVFGLIFLLIQFMGKTEEVRLFVYLAGLWLMIDSMNRLTKALFSAFEVMEYVAAVNVFEKGLYFIFCAFILFSDVFQRKLLLLIVTYPASSGLALGLGLFILRRKITKISFEIDWEFWKRVIKEGWPFAASGLFAGIYLYLDKVLLSVMKGDEVVGWYSAAYKLFMTLYAVQSFYYQALFPVASRFFKESLVKFKGILNRSSRLILSITLPLTSGGMVLASPIINLIYGQEYLNAVLVFQVLSLGFVIKGVRALYGDMILLASDHQRQYMLGFGGGAVANITLNAILIPPFSLFGAAMATVFSETAITVFFYSRSKEVVEVNFKKFVIRPLLSSILMMFILIFLIKLNLLLLISLGAISFFSFMLVLKGITAEDLRVVLSHSTNLKGKQYPTISRVEDHGRN